MKEYAMEYETKRYEYFRSLTKSLKDQSLVDLIKNDAVESEFQDACFDELRERGFFLKEENIAKLSF